MGRASRSAARFHPAQIRGVKPESARWYNPEVHPSASVLPLDSWQSYLDSEHPDAHLLQTGRWAQLKSEFGWSPLPIRWESGGALILLRQLVSGMRLAYVPKGPVGEWLPSQLAQIDRACMKAGTFMLQLEPDIQLAEHERELLVSRGLAPSQKTVQPRRTLILDITPDEEQILARMQQKTRYNIRLAERKGVSVRPWSDLESFGKMMRGTGARQEFGVHSTAYYRRAYEIFQPHNECELFVAEHEGSALAALMAFARGGRSWYFYGASTERERNRMPTYALQWAAIRWAKARGCTTYDLWGVPDEPEQALEGDFTNRNDGLWGVYRFKRGFGGELIRAEAAWLHVYGWTRYRLYQLASLARRTWPA